MPLAECLIDGCQWSQWRDDPQAAQRIYEQHLARWHADAPPATDELCQRMVAEHAGEAETVVLAIETAWRMYGRVDPNEVRPLIPPGITAQVIPSVYNVLKRQGRLRPVEQGVSNDTHGRNVGKVTTIYRLVDEASTSISAR